MQLFLKNFKINDYLITLLNKTGVISVQRTRTACIHCAYQDTTAWCNLLQQELKVKDLRIDCPEFSPVRIA